VRGAEDERVEVLAHGTYRSQSSVFTFVLLVADLSPQHSRDGTKSILLVFLPTVRTTLLLT
jgi:hypothetical protein